MTRIKGWDKQYDSGEKIGWVATARGIISTIKIREDGGWNIEISKLRSLFPKKNDGYFLSKQYKTKAQALKVAIKYMRTHPRG